QNSHLAHPQEDRAAELRAHEAQGVVSFHPAIPGAIAHIAVMQLVQIFGQTLPFSPRASFIELNLLVPRLVTRKLLRIPNCSVCRMVESSAAVSIENNRGLMPGNRR